MKKDQKVFILTENKIVDGTFISTDGVWKYILLENGKVQGFADRVIFDSKGEAQDVLIEELKVKLINAVPVTTIKK